MVSIASLAAVGLLVAGVSALTSPASASSAVRTPCAVRLVSAPAAVRHIVGTVPAARVGGAQCTTTIGTDPHAPGMRPPLVWHNGPVMGVPKAHDRVIVTPIFWTPRYYGMTKAYKNLIDQFLTDAAVDSDLSSNVFSTVFEYYGSNGDINYRMAVGTPIIDKDRFPTAGCYRNRGAIYADRSRYRTCLDDAQVRSEVNKQVTAKHLHRGLGHVYVAFLPKHVETCDYAHNPSYQQCSLNYSRSASFCGYHSEIARNRTVYANLPFPVYNSPTGYTCGSDAKFAKEQAPNGNADADAEISPLSHEVSEAITDPDTRTGWFDKAGNENGDECAYMYGPSHGTRGAKWNQTINGHHYLTQEEFSNNNYRAGLGGCMQSYVPAAAPTLTSLTPTSGSTGDLITITGSMLAGATGVTIGGTPVPAGSFTVVDQTTLTVTVPASDELGTVDVTVTNAVGTSNALQFSYGS